MMMTPREKVIRILLRILANPYQYTRRELADYFELDKKQLSGYITEIKNAGLYFDQDKPLYRCAVLPDRGFKELQHLQSLSEKDRAQISASLHRFLSSKDALYLNNKLSGLYNFQQLGLRALRRPVLEKIGGLETAQKKEIRVILKDYHSNSNNIQDRRVEPFHIDADLDTLQAYDIDKKETRHFRLSRIKRVLATEESWQYKHKHHFKLTDVFRIANDDQVWIHLRLDVYARNLLIEQFPKAKNDITDGAVPFTYDFETKVNANFMGLVNFIMANAKHIDIFSPESLKERIRQESTFILEKFTSN